LFFSIATRRFDNYSPISGSNPPRRSFFWTFQTYYPDWSTFLHLYIRKLEISVARGVSAVRPCSETPDSVRCHAYTNTIRCYPVANLDWTDPSASEFNLSGMWPVLHSVCRYTEAVTTHTSDLIGPVSVGEEWPKLFSITSFITCLYIKNSLAVYTCTTASLPDLVKVFETSSY
jgi:hypothetical protein